MICGKNKVEPKQTAVSTYHFVTQLPLACRTQILGAHQIFTTALAAFASVEHLLDSELQVVQF